MIGYDFFGVISPICNVANSMFLLFGVFHKYK